MEWKGGSNMDRNVKTFFKSRFSLVKTWFAVHKQIICKTCGKFAFWLAKVVIEQIIDHLFDLF